MSPPFHWGVATSAYQIEGGRTDGKGESIWDRFAHTPGRILDGTTGDVACDHFNRWEEDVALMAELGVTSYRFSIAWTRLMPRGVGHPHAAGVAFYDRLIDGLLAHDIEPIPTLYHWDLPQELEDRGGWRSRETVDAFTEYAMAATEAYGDRVKTWITHNEPWVASMLGHRDGIHAPGLTDWDAALTAAHHILLSHGRATRAMRSFRSDIRIGIALDCRPSSPASEAPEDLAAQRHFDGFRNRWFFDPVFGRGYPDDIMEAYRERGRIPCDQPAWLADGDIEEIGVPIDLLGINYYTSLVVGAGAEESEDTGVPPSADPPPGYTEMGWENTPAALTDYLVHIAEEYSPASILITENGASYSDGPGPDGTIEDDRRTSYLSSHIDAVMAARVRGAPVDGYFAWSLLDNFEWALGYSQRFGIVWVDHGTGSRIPKASYRWYQERIRDGL